jgi:ArsR family transcriptional regulator, lead/cadmium/zinc/bismuth-responsive transcriptional repressor
MRNREINLRNTVAQEEGIRSDDVARARAVLLDHETYADLSSLFAALADPTRAAIVHLLAHQELCTADLALTLGLHRPATSQRLRQLRQLRIVRSRRDGRLVLYSLDDTHITDLLTRGLAHVREHGSARVSHR